MKAVIMAGGKGTRLQPFTAVFPKPLMPLGECAETSLAFGRGRSTVVPALP